MGSPLFSILVPSYNRAWALPRLMASVMNQTFKDFEVWVLNDGSRDDTEEVMGELMRKDDDAKIKYWKWDKNQFKMMARGRLIDLAEGQWLVHLDSDDELLPNYLETVFEAMHKYPEAEMFNFGAVVKHADGGISYRKTFKPLMVGGGHEHFPSGKIGLGQFVYKKKLHRDVGNFPEHRDIVRFARESGIPGYTGENDPTLGNPVGDDYWLFYKLTRGHVSIPLDVDLYCQNVRTDQAEQHDGTEPKWL